MNLRRLILEFTGDGIHTRVLYRTSTGASPQTKARRREVQALAREGLTAALEALDAGDVEEPRYEWLRSEGGRSRIEPP